MTTQRARARYARAMNGTMTEQALAMREMPPKMTASENTVRTDAMSTGETLNASLTAEVMVLAWTILLVRPNWAMMATAKIQANQRLCKPLEM